LAPCISPLRWSSAGYKAWSIQPMLTRDRGIAWWSKVSTRNNQDHGILEQVRPSNVKQLSQFQQLCFLSVYGNVSIAKDKRAFNALGRRSGNTPTKNLPV
jgi:hypothetical protein